jgi:hypothetical protein
MEIYFRDKLDLFDCNFGILSHREPDVAIVDLSEVTFVDAYGLVGLACYIAWMWGDDVPIELTLPESYDVCLYLSRMHLGEVLKLYDVRVNGELPSVREHDRRDSLLELERFTDVRGGERLASFIWERLSGHTNPAVVDELFEAVGELTQNVLDHSGSPAGGFIAAQRYKAGMPDDRIVIAVGDVGIGICESLQPRYGRMTDAEAIERAIRQNVSRLVTPGRGQGLWSVVDGVNRLKGSLSIRTGRAFRWRTRRGDVMSFDVSYLQGTIVGAQLRSRPSC